MSDIAENIEDTNISEDPIIKLGNPLLEIILPDDEPTLFSALRYGDITMVERHLREGVDLNVHKEGDSCSLKGPQMSHRIKTSRYAALHVAVLHSPLQMLDLLLGHGADLDILDEQHRTPLHFAVVANRFPVIELLIARGCNVNIQSSSGRTPLLEAVINGDYDVAKLLIKAGCDPDITDTKGTGVLHQLCFTINPNLEIINLVIKKGCTIDLPNLKGATPLMYATSMKALPVVKTLVEKGANINKRDHQGHTAINFIVDYKMASGQRQNVLLYLIHQGANINGTDKTGNTMLDKALGNMALFTIKLLLVLDCPRNADNIMQHPSIQQLCDTIPEFKVWLLHELYSPKSLMRLCRGSIRQCLSPDKLLKVFDLDLPGQLQKYVLGRDILPQHMLGNR